MQSTLSLQWWIHMMGMCFDWHNQKCYSHVPLNWNASFHKGEEGSCLWFQMYELLVKWQQRAVVSSLLILWSERCPTRLFETNVLSGQSELFTYPITECSNMGLHILSGNQSVCHLLPSSLSLFWVPGVNLVLSFYILSLQLLIAWSYWGGCRKYN